MKIAVTASNNDKFTKAFKHVLGVEDPAQLLPVMVLYGATMDFYSVEQWPPAIVAHELRHVFDSYDKRWDAIIDSMLEYLPNQNGNFADNQVHLLQFLLNFLVEYEPYRIQYQYMADHAPEKTGELSQEDFLKSSLNFYSSRVEGEIFDFRNRALAKGVCRVILEHAPGALSLMFKSLDEVCGSEDFDSLTTFSMGCADGRWGTIKVIQPGNRWIEKSNGVLPDLFKNLVRNPPPLNELGTGGIITSPELEAAACWASMSQPFPGR